MVGVHYQRLGVLPNASPEEIRAAYRQLARVHHPDKHNGQTSIEMLEINEAWRILSDPVLRYNYDVGLKAHNGKAAQSEDSARQERLRSVTLDAEQRHYTPAKFPWRFVLAVIAIGTAFILVMGALGQSDQPDVIDNVLRVGSCVAVDENRQEVSEVSCAEPFDGTVEQLVPFDAVCPYPLAAYRDRQGMGLACIAKS